MANPRPITSKDLQNLGVSTPSRPMRDAEDLSPEELTERESFQRRVRDLEACAGRIRGLQASEHIRALQAETRRSLDNIWNRNARQRASDRGVPARDDVRRIALMAEPPEGQVMDTVASFLRWRAQLGERLGVVSVSGALVVLSPAGSGKSSAGGWAVTWSRESALYTTAAQVAANPLTSFSDAREAWSLLVAPDLLVIDELGRELGDKGPAAIMSLYLERDARRRATIFMGNRSASEFVSRYIAGDTAIISRFKQQRERGFEPIVAPATQDLRLQGGR